MLTRRLTSEFQYVLAIFKWMLQKYCACHEKVEPMHTKSCNREMKFATIARIQRRRLQTSTSQSAKSLRLPRETHRFRPSSNTPANVFATLTNSCACHVFCNLSKSLRLPSPKVPRDRQFFKDFDFRIALARRRGANFCEAQLPKVLRTCHVLTILISKSLSRAGVVRILSSSTAKSAPTPPVLNDFDFQIALVRRRGANFVDTLGNRSFATPVFGTCFCEPSKPPNYGKTEHFAQFLPAKISHVSHLCCKTCRQLSV